MIAGAVPQGRQAHAKATVSAHAPLLVGVVFMLAIWTPSEMTGAPIWLEGGRYLAFALLAGGTAAVGLFGPRQRRLTASTLLLLVFLGYAALSCLWAPPSLFGYTKAALLIIAAAFAFTVARRQSLAEIANTLVVTTTLFVVAGVVTALVWPAVGIESAWGLEGRWRGLAGQKNEFGALAAIALLGLLFLARPIPNTMLRAAAMASAAVALVMSGSRGAQLSFLVGMSVSAWMLARQRVALPPAMAVLAAGLSLSAGVLVSASFDVDSGLLSILGFQIDSSNRLAIWNFGFSEVAGREVFGTGLGGFWTDERAVDFQRTYGWVIENFHNGYVSSYIELGVAGLLIAACSLALALLVAIGRAVRINSNATIFAAGFVSMFVVANFIENWLVRSTNFYFLFFLCVTCAASRPMHTYSRSAR